MILARSLSEVAAAAQRGDDERVKDLIRHLVPEWQAEENDRALASSHERHDAVGDVAPEDR